MQLTTALSVLIPLASAAVIDRASHSVIPREPEALPPKEVSISGVVFAGSGCPAGSASGQLSNDNKRVTIKLDKGDVGTLKATMASTVDTRENCQYNLAFQYPKGWQFAFSRAEYQGYANVAAGGSAVSKSTYYFSGERNQISSTVRFGGPFSDKYTKIDSFPAESTVWSPCGNNESLFNVNYEVRVASTDKQSSISVNQLSQFDIQWRTC